ncbi:phosphotransferase enzyme family protein [Flavisphingomonas formosensis]|uniref:phosphotransferase enzyme family protein n=1 Tax=Flavisphingomonas formosensis TaxID=861534 RepID=UPI001E36EE80|nr:phosphotransferase [Sphingomonas formosensis]
MANSFYALAPDAQADRLRGLALKALDRWHGQFRDVNLVKYRENAVFSAYRDDGVRVALRIHRHGYHSDAALASELAWMAALADHGISVPAIVPAREGETFVIEADGGVPEPRQIDMLGWLPGTPIGSAEEGLVLSGAESERLFFDAGYLAARIHDHSAIWDAPSGFVRHAWDEDGLLGNEPFWGRFWELPQLAPAERMLLEHAAECARRDLRRFGRGEDRYGLIHADLVPENLLRHGERLMLIDFDDSGYGWHLFELATALYFNVDEPNYPMLRAALLQGYRSQRALDETHAALLDLFLFLRGTTYLGWVQTRPETETAQELGPMLVARTCRLARDYLGSLDRRVTC